MRWFLLTGLVMWAATCGQKGPLQLPTKQLRAATVSSPVFIATTARMQ